MPSYGPLVLLDVSVERRPRSGEFSLNLSSIGFTL